MYDGTVIVCDFCEDPIETEQLALVESVDRDCCATGEKELHFHLYTDKSCRYSGHHGGKGCYPLWCDSDYSFIPHGVRKVSKDEILKKLTF